MDPGPPTSAKYLGLRERRKTSMLDIGAPCGIIRPNRVSGNNVEGVQYCFST